MAMISDAARREEQAQEQLKAALTAYREMLDTFVNNQVPKAATEADRPLAAGTKPDPDRLSRR